MACQGFSFLAQLYCYSQTFKLNALIVRKLSCRNIYHLSSTFTGVSLQTKKTQEHSWKAGLSPFTDGLSWRHFSSFFAPVYLRSNRVKTKKKIKPWYACLCWDPWVKVERREKSKLELHQIWKTDKPLLSIGAVLRQLAASGRKDCVNFLELLSFCLFLESFMRCWNIVLHNCFSPSLLFSGFCCA